MVFLFWCEKKLIPKRVWIFVILQICRKKWKKKNYYYDVYFENISCTVIAEAFVYIDKNSLISASRNYLKYAAITNRRTRGVKHIGHGFREGNNLIITVLSTYIAKRIINLNWNETSIYEHFSEADTILFP